MNECTWMGKITPAAPAIPNPTYNASKQWLYQVADEYKSSTKAAVSSTPKDDSEDVIYEISFEGNGNSSIGNGSVTFKNFGQLIINENREEISLIMIIKSVKSDLKKRVSFRVSKQQAYHYMLLSGNVFVVSALSSDLGQVKGILDFTLMLFKKDELDKGYQKYLEGFDEGIYDFTPNVSGDLDGFMQTGIDNLIGGFSSQGVSFASRTPFPTGGNISKLQVERSNNYLHTWQAERNYGHGPSKRRSQVLYFKPS